MPRSLFVTCIFLSLGTAVGAEHPFARAQLGDWAWYMTKTLRTPESKTTLPANVPASVRRKFEEALRSSDQAAYEPKEARLQVTRKTETDVVVTSMSRENGRDFESRWTIDLTQPYQPFPKMSSPARELGQGTEVLAVDGDRLETTWIEYETEYGSLAGVMAKETWKIWRSPKIPIDGMVRMERSFVSGALKRVTVTELTNSGRDRPPSK